MLSGLFVAMPVLAAGHVGMPLPALELPNVSGKLIPLRGRYGQVTVINFWAAWCAPCRDEIPEMVKVDEHWQDHDVRVVGIAVDSGTPKEISAFASEHGVDYTVLVADAAWARQHFALTGIPVTLVVDRHGVIRAWLSGPQTAERLIHVISRYLRR